MSGVAVNQKMNGAKSVLILERGGLIELQTQEGGA